MRDNEGRISTVEANIKNLSDSMGRIENLQLEGFRQRTTQHNETIQRLSVIETLQTDFKRYQIDCDDDRKELSGETQALQLDFQSYKSRQSGIAIATSAIISGLIAIGGFIVGRH